MNQRQIKGRKLGKFSGNSILAREFHGYAWVISMRSQNKTKKLGGAIRPHNQMQLFRDVIDECSFMDLGYMGPKFTWNKHFENGHSIWDWLDRGMATNGWFLKFPSSRVYHLQGDSSDHRPLPTVFAPLDLPQRKKPFRFKRMWLSNSSCEETVQAAWHHTSGTDLNKAVLAKVEKCGTD